MQSIFLTLRITVWATESCQPLSSQWEFTWRTVPDLLGAGVDLHGTIC